MRRFLMAMSLTSVLTGAAMAGDIPSVGVPAPPPPCVDCVAKSSPSPGEIPSGGLAEELSNEAWLGLVTALSSLVG